MCGGATCLINEEYRCDYSGASQEAPGHRDGGGDSDLHGTVPNTGDELDQLLHGLRWLGGQEVLLIGRVEDDDRGDRNLAGNTHQIEFKKRRRRRTTHTHTHWSFLEGTNSNTQIQY